MKKKRRPLFWTIGILLIIASIGGFGQGDYGAATIWLIVGIILLPPIREKLFSKKQNENVLPQTSSITTGKALQNQEKISINDVIKVSSESTGSNETTITLDLLDENKLMQFVQQNEKEKQNRIKNFQYLPQQVSGSVVQTLESIQIMDTTKNFDTLKGRHQFVEEKIDFLKLASHNKRYLTDVQTGLDQYKTLYYDKVPTQQQIAALLKPNEFNYDEFHCQCILNSFQRFYEEQNKQIASLKRPDAIKNRREKIMDTIREIQNDIPSMADSFSEAHDRLEKIYQTVFQETYG
ncbi:MAG: hypothetical protein JST34_03400 [Bacteroidetes bacterium]|jgi:hypothetical protein|nr:hypothetical protein [Bacteroidota bacterium]